MTRKSMCIVSVFAVLSISMTGAVHAGVDLNNLNWSIEYQLENDNLTQPDDNRGLALDPSGQYLYLGYNNSSTTRAVNKVDLQTGNVVASVSNIRGKSIAVDDVGRVYTTGVDGEGVLIYDANLNYLYTITMNKTEGVAVRREGGTLALYATDRNAGTLSRFELSESGGSITGGTLAGLDGDGVLSISGGIRGVGLDGNGKIWVANPGGNTVYRMNSDGTDLMTATLTTPYYFGFSGDQVFVTQNTARTVSVIDVNSLTITDTLTPPWAALGLDADGAGDPRNGTIGSYGAISGIAMLADASGFYLTNERGVSTDTLYREAVIGVNIPEPASFCLLAAGGLMLLKRRKH